ncbi:MAG: NAD(P)-dependent oxidoreductase [Betaproteobacteria bacterium]|nr:NAD(P)-dependent oxidoreductase [Betaproteobacteria bacterium]
MKVLVTGSSGRVGSVIAMRIAKTHDVVGLDIVAGPQTTRLGSINDGQLVDALTSTVDAVVHTAGLHAPHVGLRPEAAFHETNVGGTKCLIDAALKYGVGRFVFTSTTSLYGAAMVAADHAVWVTEELSPVARDIYDETKLAAEQICRTAALAGLPCISLRMSRCFPEPDELMAIYRLYRGVDARDVAKAHLLALESDIGGFEIFNISAAPVFRRNECEELFASADRVIARHYSWSTAAFAHRSWSLPKRIDRVYVINKAERMLGYRPQFNFESLFDPDETGPA